MSLANDMMIMAALTNKAFLQPANLMSGTFGSGSPYRNEKRFESGTGQIHREIPGIISRIILSSGKKNVIFTI
jgi:hypothetical protein